MTNVVTFRRYKFANVVESKFLKTTDSRNLDFAEKDLAKSGLTLDDIEGYVHPGLPLMDKAIAGYVIPYYDLAGKPLLDKLNNIVMWRMKLAYPEFIKGQKYNSVSSEFLAGYNLPPLMPYIPPTIHDMVSDVLICAEGEKKCASIIKFLGLPAFGIGGCQMWRDPDGSGKPHRWILELINQRMPRTIIVVPDGDVLRYDICSAYGTFVRALQKELPGVEIQILHPDDKIDDLLVKWGDKAKEEWAKIPLLDDSQLVQSPKSLIDEFSLAVKVSNKGVPTVLEHTSNVTKLLDAHKAFPKIWVNLDSSKLMLGEDEIEDKRTDMEIANYFQYNFGMASVKANEVKNCIHAIARKNKVSPFFEYIRRQVWDGVPRLDTWLTDYWGLEDINFHREISSKFLIASCARQDKPGSMVQWMFITIGPQRTGKTSMPSVLFPGNSKLLIGQCDDKDMLLKMHSSLCIGFDELDSFNKRAQENLKAIITEVSDTFRPPYGAITEDHPRRFMMYGSGNRRKFLQKDPSGYRRYAITTVDKLFDFDGFTLVRDQLWAEAWQRYQAGVDEYWWVTEADKFARNYTIDYPLTEAIENWIAQEQVAKQSTRVKYDMLWFTMGDILHGLNQYDQIKNTQFTQQINALLVELGCSPPDKKQRGPTGGNPQRYYTIPLDGSLTQ